ncbi:hypothetical protein E3N88_27864 [Mikania micrantha]|uniref:Uncharacterized protein n=1 Tax=Mikania micrantha TaxID=192012 RepID=A0A5N6MXV8_9ASTR|nr:hypothetical protein E3N88_27864 [Mikania micrantha]
MSAAEVVLDIEGEGTLHPNIWLYAVSYDSWFRVFSHGKSQARTPFRSRCYWDRAVDDKHACDHSFTSKGSCWLLLKLQVTFVSCLLHAPFVIQVWKGATYATGNDWVESLWIDGWKVVGVTLFTIICGERVASQSNITLLTSCGGVGYLLLLQAGFRNSAGIAAKFLECIASFLQVPVVMAILLGDQFPKQDVNSPILLITSAICVWVLLIKLQYLKFEHIAFCFL